MNKEHTTLQTPLLQTLTGHSDGVRSIVASSDGNTIFSCSNDKSIKIWDLKSGKLLQTLTGHSASLSSIAVSLDGTTIVSGSDDYTIKVWIIILENYFKHSLDILTE